MGESEGGMSILISQAYKTLTKRPTSASPHPSHWGNWHSWIGWGSWEQRKGVDTHVIHHIDLKNHLQILLASLWTPPRGLPMNTMGLLTCRSPPLNGLTHAPSTSHTPWDGACTPLQMASESLFRQLVDSSWLNYVGMGEGTQSWMLQGK